ncbi:hypothetical protein [Streptomyces sp. AS02]|uniref:hypothetical protein n=1 Tax=Streptomyces sp. AS02 TaxID=2938946 RepID=UPI00201FF218|nr:hypothetical protein [Streptomyces sp. AS02]MCL8017914.1 hypothetical protein [Streptomyces sp. AS02]
MSTHGCLIHAVPPIHDKRGRSRQRPDVLYADRGHDHDVYRRQVRELGIHTLIARRGTGHGSGPGRNRRVAEAAFALLRWFRRLRILREIRAAHPPGLPHPRLRNHLLAAPQKNSADLSPQPEPATSASPSGVRR